MPSTATFRESRRSTRVPLKVVITVQGGAEPRTCEGETIVVNLHGALIATAIGLTVGMRVSIHAYLTSKHAGAWVVYIDPKNPLRCGIELMSHETSGAFPCRPTTGTRPQSWKLGVRDVLLRAASRSIQRDYFHCRAITTS